MVPYRPGSVCHGFIYRQKLLFSANWQKKKSEESIQLTGVINATQYHTQMFVNL